MASDDMTYIEIFNREQKVEESLSTTGHIALKYYFSFNYHLFEGRERDRERDSERDRRDHLKS